MLASLHSVTAKIMLFVQLSLSAIILAFSFYFDQRAETTILAQNERALKLLASSISSGIHTIMLSGEGTLAGSFIETIRMDTKILDFRILRPDGLEAFQDNSTIRHVNQQIGQERFTHRSQEHLLRVLEADDPNLLNALAQKRPQSVYHRLDEQAVMTILAPIQFEKPCISCHTDRAHTLGVMKITTSLSQVASDIRRTHQEALLMGSLALIIVLSLSYPMMRRLLILPLARLKRSMDRVADGDLTERIQVPGKDELSRIADTFNEMAARLHATHAGLQQERDKLGTIIHSVQEGIVVTDAHDRIILVNPAMARLLDKPMEQIEADGFLNLLDNPATLRPFLDQERQSLPTTLTYKEKHLQVQASTFHEGGKRIGSAALIRDITEEFRLREQFQEIIRQAPFGIIVADDQGRIHLFNPAAERMFGAASADLIGGNIVALIPPSLAEKHAVQFQRFFLPDRERTDQAPTFESTALRQDGSTFPVRLAVNAMRLDGRRAIVGMISDISEEKQMLEDLIQSAKMAGLGCMVAGVAHEINTPVGIGVTAASELKERTTAFQTLVQTEGISEEELHACIDSTQRLTDLTLHNLIRAAELVRSFKSVAVDQSSEQARTFKVREYVESTILTMHHELRNSRLNIRIDCDAQLEIHCHPGAISQILINLINNSRLHAFEPDEEGEVILAFQALGDRLRFVYRDNGKGMSEESRQRIFEPFYTTRRDLGGSGLGMHIVYNLATQSLGGTISCQSAPGCGITIQMEIPLPR